MRCLLSLCWASVAAAQSVVVPGVHRDSDAPAVTIVAGVSKDARQQILVDAARLGVTPGTALTSIAFRRDARFSGALVGGHARATISLSHAPRSATIMSARHHGAETY